MSDLQKTDASALSTDNSTNWHVTRRVGCLTRTGSDASKLMLPHNCSETGLTSDMSSSYVHFYDFSKPKPTPPVVDVRAASDW